MHKEAVANPARDHGEDAVTTLPLSPPSTGLITGEKQSQRVYSSAPQVLRTGATLRGTQRRRLKIGYLRSRAAVQWWSVYGAGMYAPATNTGTMYSANRHYLLRTPATLGDPICAKRLNRY